MGQQASASPHRIRHPRGQGGEPSSSLSRALDEGLWVLKIESLVLAVAELERVGVSRGIRGKQLLEEVDVRLEERSDAVVVSCSTNKRAGTVENSRSRAQRRDELLHA